MRGVHAHVTVDPQLQPGNTPDQPVTSFWPDIDLDLSQATLVNFELSDCRVRAAQFNWARFVGTARFLGTQFVSDAGFYDTHFSTTARLDGAVFTGDAVFVGAEFDSVPNFNELPAFDGDDSRTAAVFVRGVPSQVAQYLR